MRSENNDVKGMLSEEIEVSGECEAKKDEV
jgi:hypothetical protein